jgi:hypothetical protein
LKGRHYFLPLVILLVIARWPRWGSGLGLAAAFLAGILGVDIFGAFPYMINP